MSDLYDSLEEDESGSGSKNFSNIQGLCEEATGMESVGWARKSESTDNYSFYLNQNVTQEKVKLIPDFNSSGNQKKSFLPRIENDTPDKGLEFFGNMIVDNQILSKQGLQLNDDGSFTKSPRSDADADDLPFIAREYRNLQFQKRKTYRLKKRTSMEKIPVKNNLSSTKKSVGIRTKNETIKVKNKENKNEDFLNTPDSLSLTPRQVKKDFEKESDTINNSAKEKNLLENQKYHSSKSIKPIKDLKKTKREKVSTRTLEILETNKALDPKRREIFNQHFRENSSGSRNSKNSEYQIYKHQSDILLNTPKRNLNYSEQHRLKNGYSPRYLHYWSKKVISDTNRSNFGDSVVEDLPELPSLNCNTGVEVDEDEEMFYQKLIEKEKNLKEKNQFSFRSDGPLERKKLNRVIGLNSYLGESEAKNEKNVKNAGMKRISKSLSIDLSPEAEPSKIFSKKPSHYCSIKSLPTPSKVELALKGKTYGYIVNARNVFNLKAQAKRRSDPAEKNDKAHINENSFAFPKKVSDLSPNQNKSSKLKSSSVKRLSNVMEGLPKTLEKSPTNSLIKPRIFDVSVVNQKRVILPEVNNFETKSNKSKKKVFCIKSSKKEVPS